MNDSPYPNAESNVRVREFLHGLHGHAIKLLEKILMTQKELGDKLDAFIARETKLDDAIKALVAAAKSAGDVPPEVADKITALEAAFTTAETDAAGTPPAPPAA